MLSCIELEFWVDVQFGDLQTQIYFYERIQKKEITAIFYWWLERDAEIFLDQIILKNTVHKGEGFNRT